MDRPHLRSIGINDLIRWNEDNVLELSPKFQRRRVWPIKAKAYLIDTILHGLPIPKLYMRQHLDLNSTKTIREIVDGQQRLRAVLDFYAGAFKLSADISPYGSVTYSNLPEDAKRQFLKYEFSVDVLIDAADADVLDIFARINSYSVPLNDQEKRNAKYYGSFKNTAYSLGLEHLEFWKRNRILTDQAITRMKEAELTSELLIGMSNGLQDKKKSINVFYQKWDDKYPYRRESVTRFRDIIDLIDEHIGDYLSTSNFRRSALFYSLFLAVYESRYRAIGSIKERKRSIDGERIKSSLLKLDGILGSDEPPKKYLRFVTACQRQTDNIQPRRTRHATLIDAFVPKQ